MIERQYGEFTTFDTRADSHEAVDKAKRYSQIRECLQEREMTAKECAVRMHEKGYIPTSERNFTAPRLTEMANKGIVDIIGKKKCAYTGRTVAVYTLMEI